MLIMVIFVLKFPSRCAKSIISALNQSLPKRKLDKGSFHVIDKLEYMSYSYYSFSRKKSVRFNKKMLNIVFDVLIEIELRKSYITYH